MDTIRLPGLEVELLLPARHDLPVAPHAKGTTPRAHADASEKGDALFLTIRRASRPTLEREDAPARAAIVLQSRFRARATRRRYARVRKILVHLQAAQRGMQVRKTKPLEVKAEDKKRREGHKAVYKSTISSHSLDWRLESLTLKHERITLVALGGVATMVVVSELAYDDWKAALTEAPLRFTEALTALRYVLLVQTLLVEAMLLDYHRSMWASLKPLFGSRPPLPDYALLVARDLLVCAVFPCPDRGLADSIRQWVWGTGAESGYLVGELGLGFLGVEDMFAIVSVAMFARVPLCLFRRLWLRSKAIKLKARFLARSYHLDLNLRLAIRVAMRDQGVSFLLTVGVTAVGIFGYVYYVLERQQAYAVRFDSPDSYNPFISPEYFLNSVWTNTIVMIGIGFDYPPQTYLGRVVLVLNAIAGLALFALMTAAFADALSLKDAELRLMHVVQRAEGVRRIQSAAVRVIQRAWKHTHHHRSVMSALPRWARRRLPGAPLSPEPGQRQQPRPFPPLPPPPHGCEAGARAGAGAGAGGGGGGAEAETGACPLAQPGLQLRSPASSFRQAQRLLGQRLSRLSACGSVAGTEASLPDTPTRQGRAVVRVLKESLLDAAETRLRRHADGTHHKALMRAVNDWKVERHRNATTSEMIENVTSVLKDVRETVEEQGRELGRVLKRVDVLVRMQLPRPGHAPGQPQPQWSSQLLRLPGLEPERAPRPKGFTGRSARPARTSGGSSPQRCLGRAATSGVRLAGTSASLRLAAGPGAREGKRPLCVCVPGAHTQAQAARGGASVTPVPSAAAGQDRAGKSEAPAAPSPAPVMAGRARAIVFSLAARARNSNSQQPPAGQDDGVHTRTK